MPDETSAFRSAPFDWQALLPRMAAVVCSVLVHLCILVAWSIPVAPATPVAPLHAGLRGLNHVSVPALPELKLSTGRARAPVLVEQAPVPQVSAEGAVAADRLPVFRRDDYLPADTLEERPVFPDDMETRILDSIDERESGRVVVQMLIAADGTVDKVLPETSALSESGTQIFLQHLAALHLRPGMQEGRAVKTRWHLEFNFSAEP